MLHYVSMSLLMLLGYKLKRTENTPPDYFKKLTLISITYFLLKVLNLHISGNVKQKINSENIKLTMFSQTNFSFLFIVPYHVLIMYHHISCPHFSIFGVPNQFSFFNCSIHKQHRRKRLRLYFVSCL